MCDRRRLHIDNEGAAMGDYRSMVTGMVMRHDEEGAAIGDCRSMTTGMVVQQRGEVRPLASRDA
ncbi:divergent polysaccharide deacetylase family protein [Sesbania bispinosa]|nr:divergent polysaccharide deacetylase family protein [Sesbania bispinosa]